MTVGNGATHIDDVVGTGLAVRSHEQFIRDVKYKNLRFRRQYLLTTRKIDVFSDWQYAVVGPFHVYAHPDVELSVSSSADKQLTVALIGYMIDPNQPTRSNIQILHDLLESIESVDDVSDYLYSIGGRFVLLMSAPTDTFIFHDPCGLRTVYYTMHDGMTYVGSQPLAFNCVMPLKVGDRFVAYQNSQYKHSKIGHWIPSGCSLYENIHHLIPNHYLRISDLKQIRYWPIRSLEQRGVDEVAGNAAELLQCLMDAANQRFKLALPLTAGQDSRILLSASKNIAADVFFYTLQYRDLHSQSADIRIPEALLHTLGYEHHLIDCRGEMDTEFGEIYDKNTSLNHRDDWGLIACGMLNRYPLERVCIKGNCSEICRCFYYKSGKHAPIESAKRLISLERGWSELPFVGDVLLNWFSEADVAANQTGVDILDLFYWEHRMGSWQAQSQLEWDIVQEAYTPFNHRLLLEMMLCVPSKFRRAPDYKLYRRMVEILWPEVLTHPINPPEKSKDKVKNILFRLGMERIARKTYRAVSDAVFRIARCFGWND